jgi:hypothetical protein
MCLQGQGRLSHNKRSRFAELTDNEVTQMEAIVKNALTQVP